jgi:hypothetical protein
MANEQRDAGIDSIVVERRGDEVSAIGTDLARGVLENGIERKKAHIDRVKRRHVESIASTVY